MAEADAEHWHSAEEFLDVFDGVANRLGIAGAIRKEHAVGFEIEDVLGRSLRWNDPDIGIAWPLDGMARPLLSEKDAAPKPLREAEVFA